MKLRRIHPGEWLTGFAGLAGLAGLALLWSGDSSGYGSPSVLKLLVVAVSLAALLVPVVVASSVKTDLPVTWETFLSSAATFVAVILVLRLIFRPEAGLATGFFVVLAAVLLICIAGWRSVAREN